MSDNVRILPPWTKDYCEHCGEYFQASRIEERVIVGDLICWDCITYEEAFNEGLDSALKEIEKLQQEIEALKASQSKVKAEGIREVKSNFFIDMDDHRTFHEVEKDDGETFKAWFYYECDIEKWFDNFASQLEKGE